MARPVIALLTDFGLHDHYAGTMKGVALGICPEAALVDITHDIPPQDILAAALELAAAYRYFPAGTVFLVVVDPGVGSARRGIAMACGTYRFVAPDNGVLTAVIEMEPSHEIVELTNTQYARATVSRTFEGRDRFAPAAAWLASGVDLRAMGPAVDGPIRLRIPRPTIASDRIDGEVLRVDRFGNLISNIDRRAIDGWTNHPFEVRIGPHRVSRIVSTYAEAAAGEICALFGSTDHLEVAASGASAAERLAVGRGAAVTVARRA